MKRRWIALSVLTVLASISLFIGVVRVVAVYTIFNPPWYTKMENDIFYAQRLAKEMNVQVKEELKQYDIPVTNYFSVFTAEEVQEILNLRTATILKMDKQTYMRELDRLNELTLMTIQDKAEQAILKLKLNTLPDENTIKSQIIHIISQRLIKIDDWETYENRMSYFNVLLYACSKPIAIIMIMLLFIVSFLGFIHLYQLKWPNIMINISWILVITGIWCHAFVYLMERIEDHKFLNAISLNNELTRHAHNSMILMILYMAKGLLVVGIAYLGLSYASSEYKKVNLLKVK